MQKTLLSLHAEQTSPPFDATRENSIFCLIHSGLFFMGGLKFVELNGTLTL
jgi:hypothetical protein